MTGSSGVYKASSPTYPLKTRVPSLKNYCRSGFSKASLTRAMKFQLVPILGFASPCLAQVAANPPEGKHYSPVPLNTLSENSTSVNVAPYQSNTSLYYLGYKDEDWSRPFVKYWKPAVKQISDEVQKGITESPHASKLGMLPADQLCVPADLFTSFQPSRGAALFDPARILAVGKRLGCERR